MGWESRGGRGRYYTRSRKASGRVVREYVGGGLIGLLAARDDEERRQRAAEDRERFRQEQDAFTAVAAPHERLNTVADALMTAALVAAGYHRHDRGQWRKRHASKTGQ
jgi:hypothetical protein